MSTTSRSGRRDRRGSVTRDDASHARASRRGVIGAGLVAVLAATASARAAEPDDKPFAQHHLALQLSDRAADKQAFVLSVAYNMLTQYGPDKIAIEVVALGPGIDLLRQESPHRAEVDSLVSQGVRFSVCMFTIETIERNTKKPVALNPRAQHVAAGVARLLTLAENGYTVVRP
jgi:intracellular sulfur oxidation DsrE/DsrF family protein